MKDFSEWAVRFAAWLEVVRPILSRRVPGEVALLNDEAQRLEPMRFEAAEFAADAISYYYSAKNLHMDLLMKEGYPKSALDSLGKAASHRELRAKELAERLCEVISSRSFKVAQHLKLTTETR